MGPGRGVTSQASSFKGATDTAGLGYSSDTATKRTDCCRTIATYTGQPAAPLPTDELPMLTAPAATLVVVRTDPRPRLPTPPPTRDRAIPLVETPTTAQRMANRNSTMICGCVSAVSVPPTAIVAVTACAMTCDVAPRTITRTAAETRLLPRAGTPDPEARIGAHPPGRRPDARHLGRARSPPRPDAGRTRPRRCPEPRARRAPARGLALGAPRRARAGRRTARRVLLGQAVGGRTVRSGHPAAAVMGA